MVGYFFLDGAGTQHGPITADIAKQCWDNGMVNEATACFATDGTMKGWAPLKDTPLFAWICAQQAQAPRQAQAQQQALTSQQQPSQPQKVQAQPLSRRSEYILRDDAGRQIGPVTITMLAQALMGKQVTGATWCLAADGSMSTFTQIKDLPLLCTAINQEVQVATRLVRAEREGKAATTMAATHRGRSDRQLVREKRDHYAKAERERLAAQHREAALRVLEREAIRQSKAAEAKADAKAASDQLLWPLTTDNRMTRRVNEVVKHGQVRAWADYRADSKQAVRPLHPQRSAGEGLQQEQGSKEASWWFSPRREISKEEVQSLLSRLACPAAPRPPPPPPYNHLIPRLPPLISSPTIKLHLHWMARPSPQARPSLEPGDEVAGKEVAGEKVVGKKMAGVGEAEAVDSGLLSSPPAALNKMASELSEHEAHALLCAIMKSANVAVTSATDSSDRLPTPSRCEGGAGESCGTAYGGACSDAVQSTPATWDVLSREISPMIEVKASSDGGQPTTWPVSCPCALHAPTTVSSRVQLHSPSKSGSRAPFAPAAARPQPHWGYTSLKTPSYPPPPISTSGSGVAISPRQSPYATSPRKCPLGARQVVDPSSSSWPKSSAAYEVRVLPLDKAPKRLLPHTHR